MFYPDRYKDKNAYFMEGAHKRIAQPAMRDYLGHVTATQQDVNYYELALGNNSRSGVSGEIHPEVAAYWREHYDMSHILQRDWAMLGPKLRGKIHLYVGSADTYFLNDAVYYIEDFLKGATNP